MKALEAALREDFTERAEEHFLRHFAQKAKEKGWEDRLWDALARAESVYGLKSERDLLTFVSLCGRLGWEFEQLAENRWMRDCLVDRRISEAGERMALLLARMRMRAEIAANNEIMRAEFRNKRNARPAAAAAG